MPVLQPSAKFLRGLQWLTLTLGAATCALIVVAFSHSTTSVEGRLIPAHQRPENAVWDSITAEEIERGVSLPAHTHVIIHIPESVDRITRKTLFGRRGKDVRYWGYCFPKTRQEAQERLDRGLFPGVLFLSEKEREVRTELRREQRVRNFSGYEDLNEDYLNKNLEPELEGRIRHRKEVFESLDICYVQTEQPLPVGTDHDQDGANIAVERDQQSDPTNPDTDGDGVIDGLEIFGLKSSPIQRDTDGDGLIDGLEDKNRNGRLDPHETSVTDRDTDKDGLCDGFCFSGGNSQDRRGEDLNLNGILDDGEFDPTKQDTDGNGIFDEQEFLNCLAVDGVDC